MCGCECECGCGCECRGLGKTELDAHEEEVLLVVLMLVGVEDVCAVLIEHAGDTGHQTATVGAVDKENSGVFHALSRVTEQGAGAGAVRSSEFGGKTIENQGP